MMVRCILAETTMPERIRPRIEIWPVKGHFLSMLLDGEAGDNATNISSLDGLLGGLEAQTDMTCPCTISSPLSFPLFWGSGRCEAA